MRDGFYVDEVNDTRYISEGAAHWFTHSCGNDRIEAFLDKPTGVFYIHPRKYAYYLPEEYLI